LSEQWKWANPYMEAEAADRLGAAGRLLAQALIKA